tara:strand:+ start:243 stop:416 length:174 start_codon:yes stop_codon:yes gene_type:complete
MNDLLNDIVKLKAIQETVNSINGIYFTKKILEDMIIEKENIITNFEKSIKLHKGGCR